MADLIWAGQAAAGHGIVIWRFSQVTGSSVNINMITSCCCTASEQSLSLHQVLKVLLKALHAWPVVSAPWHDQC